MQQLCLNLQYANFDMPSGYTFALEGRRFLNLEDAMNGENSIPRFLAGEENPLWLGAAYEEVILFPENLFTLPIAKCTDFNHL